MFIAEGRARSGECVRRIQSWERRPEKYTEGAFSERTQADAVDVTYGLQGDANRNVELLLAAVRVLSTSVATSPKREHAHGDVRQMHDVGRTIRESGSRRTKVRVAESFWGAASAS